MLPRKQAVFKVLIDGGDVTGMLLPVVQSITVSDQAGRSADTASVVIDDRYGRISFPRYNAKITILLGWRSGGVAVAFDGLIDEVRSSGGRGGQTIIVSAKGVDTSGKIKEPQNRHFDDMTIEDILKKAGEYCGVTDIRVDQDYKSKVLDYESMDNESFVEFGERLAKENGGTFKMRNDIAVMAKKNSGRSPAGPLLMPVTAIYGVNMHGWDVAPYIGRARYKQIRVRYYDRAAAKHDEVVIDTDIEGSDAIAVGKFEAANKKAAQSMAESLKTESERVSGVGTVTIEGNVGAVAEADCIIIGARAGVDGAYVIDGVEHSYSRGSGFVTNLSLGYPKGKQS